MTSSKTLQQAIADITIWRKGEQRAPHKPLLLLHVLAGYQQDHGRLFDYGSEVRDPLHSLLERFGPQRAQYRPDMPFWRLQGDGFWELQNAEQCSTSGSSKQPPAGELVTHNVAGGFDEQHFALLKRARTSLTPWHSKPSRRTSPKAFRKKSRMNWGLISCKSANSGTRCSASRFCALITMNAPFVASICATTALQLRLKRPISNGNSMVARARFQTAWRCVQSTIKLLIKVRLGWMRVCGFRCHPQ